MGIEEYAFDQLYLSRSALVHFFQASEFFGKENVKLLPLFANFGYFPANLCFFGVLFADLNSVVMYQD